MDKGLLVWLWGSIIVALVIVIGYFDLLTAYEFDFLLFYFLPISLAAWFLGRGASLTLAVICGIVWAGADVLSGHEYTSHFYGVWNLLIRLVAFLVIGWSVYKIRYFVDHEREIAETLRLARNELELRVRERTMELQLTMAQLQEEVIERQGAEMEIKKINEKLERRVMERTVQLEAANKELEAFSYSVAHDLKAPVRAIEGFSRMLVAKHSAKLDTEVIRLLNVVCINTKRMSHLIDDLLAFSRLGQQQIRKSIIDLSVLAQKLFQQFLDQVPERDLQLTVNDLPPALGDPSLINQVVVNLLANAVKYTRPGKTAVIEIGGQTEGGETVYYVKDNGIGFDERYAQKIFGVFERLHSADEYDGTGIGLAIVKRIIERHGGRVWAEGKVNEGAIFSFALPKDGN
jgi:light-regulated signal transduction histidine kinase (bacteriophytochrome)